MTLRSNDQGPAGPQRQGAANGAASRAGNGRKHVDQGDLWSDAPAAAPETHAQEREAAAKPVPAPGSMGAAAAGAALEGAAANGGASTSATAPRRESRTITRQTPAAPVRPAPRRVEPPPAPPVIEEPYDFEDDAYYEQVEAASMLRNPYVLAGLAVAVAIVLAVLVVFVFGQGGDTGGVGVGSGADGNNGAVAGNPTAQSTVPSVAGLQVKSLTTATVHSGPGLDFLDLGLLRSNQDVQVVGRNDDASWYEIIFPPGSKLGGWVVASALKLPDNAADKVAVVQATPVPRPSVPPTSTAAPVTPTPAGNTDIAIHVPPVCKPGQPIEATIDNTGDVALTDVSIRLVVTQNGATLFDATYKATMAPGQSVQPQIQADATPPSVTVTATLVGLTETRSENNSSTCTVGNVPNNQNNNVPPPVPTASSVAPAPTPRSR